MKKLMLVAVGVISAASLFAQGKVEFNTLVATAPYVRETDGTTKLVGSAYLADMFYGTAGSDPSTWASAGLAVPFLGVSVPGQAGLVSGGFVTLTGFDWGSSVGVQLRAWRATDGATWAAANANTVAPGHVSPVTAPTVTLTIPAYPDKTQPEPTGPRLVGMTGHSLVLAPEPSTILLGLAGIGGLLFLRRKMA